MTGGHIGGVVGNVLLQWLLSKRTAEVPRDAFTSRFELNYGAPYRWSVVLLVLVASFFLVFEVAVFRDDLNALLISSCIFVPLWGASVYGAFDAFCVGVSVSESGLHKTSFLAEAVFLRWADVNHVSYSTLGNWFTFRGGQGVAVRVSIYRNGLATLAQHAGAGLKASPIGKAPYLLFEKARNP